MGTAPTTSRPLAFTVVSPAKPFRHTSLTPRTFMAVETELERKVEEATTTTTTSINDNIQNSTALLAQDGADECETPEELSETQKLMAKVKDAGTAGIVSYALWELAFWFVSVPVCVFGYRSVTGHWPDLSNAEDQAQLGAEGTYRTVPIDCNLRQLQKRQCSQLTHSFCLLIQPLPLSTLPGLRSHFALDWR